MSPPPAQKEAVGPGARAVTHDLAGFGTKIHLKTDHDGLPIAFDLTGGEASDSRHFETLMNLGPDVRPRAAVADKGYDSAANHEVARTRGAVPVIPFRKNTKAVPKIFATTSIAGGPVSSRLSAS